MKEERTSREREQSKESYLRGQGETCTIQPVTTVTLTWACRLE